MDLSARMDEAERALESGDEALAQSLLAGILAVPRAERRAVGSRPAELAERLGMLTPAVAEWEALLEEGVGAADALRRLLALHRAAGRPAQALELLERRGNLLGPDERAAETIALLAESGRLGEATETLESARRAGRLRDEIVTELEELLASLGAWRQAEPDGGTPDGASSEEDAEDLPAGETFSPGLPSVADADIVRFLHRFSGREDTHARMWLDAEGRTGYSPIRAALTPRDVRNHLLGNVTLGVYPLRRDGRVAFFVLDLDITPGGLAWARADERNATEVRNALRSESDRLRDRLRALGFDPLVEASGFKGRHIWVFLEPAVSADLVCRLGDALLATMAPSSEHLAVEFFPKQARPGRRGLGNLVKLPLGVHLRTGRRSVFLDDAGRPVGDPHAVLRRVHPADEEAVRRALERIGDASAPSAAQRSAAGTADDGEQEQPTEPLPPPPTRRAVWTAADFERDPAVASLLRGCPLLAALVREIEQHRRPTADEIAVLRNTLGHLPCGVPAVNYLLDLCEGVPPSERMKSRLRGNPSSCHRVRQRLSRVFPGDTCRCEFPEERLAGSYPTPLLHVPPELLGPPSTERDDVDDLGRSPEDVARLIANLERRRREIEQEIAALRDDLIEWMRATGTDVISVDGRFLERADEDGVETLRWRASGNGAENGSADPS
ncbi:MAG: hypothetical protein D6738_14680 [Acidobacteria bacterium]|nr:MAG: hypothetical protein D6738_14680 [Acidobacteriota bacterium]